MARCEEMVFRSILCPLFIHATNDMIESDVPGWESDQWADRTRGWALQ